MPASFVDAAAVVKAVVDMRYFGDHNFVGERIDGYERPRCLLDAAGRRALAAVQRDLAARGLGLKVFDCYRPARAVAHFVRWARDLADLRGKAEFYPEVDKRDLFKLGYIAERSGHSRGSTRRSHAGAQRPTAAKLDMGTPFDFFSPKSWPSDTSVSEEARQQPRATRRGDDAPRLQALRQGMVAFHARARTVPEDVFRFS